MTDKEKQELFNIGKVTYINCNELFANRAIEIARKTLSYPYR